MAQQRDTQSAREREEERYQWLPPAWTRARAEAEQTTYRTHRVATGGAMVYGVHTY